MKKTVLIVLFLFFCGTAVQAGEFEEGTHYDRIAEQSTETGDKIEVLEFFWYGCPHCYTFEPVVQQWLKTKPANVEFIRVPVVFRPEWKVHARTYYSLQVMGLIDQLHEDIFKEIQKNRKRLDTESSMIDFIASKGINREEFTEVFKSFSIDGKLRKAIKLLKDYNIEGVPAMAVNGKYLITGKKAGSYENMTRIADHLVSKETAAARTN